jgi:uncharacterized membrane protein
MARPGGGRGLLSEEERRRVVEAIGAAEDRSRGEIRVHVERRCPGGDPVARAGAVFARLGMAGTELRSGVLVYVAADDRVFAIVGDRGIDEKVGAEFWREVAAAMERRFAEGEFAAGLVEAIGRAGDALAAHFPRDPAGRPDVDELPDDVSFGDEPSS